MGTSLCGLIEEIRVMLVHHGTKFVTKMAELLESNEYKAHELIAKKAFDNGTYLYPEKSIDETIVKNLWQFVLREKIQKEKMREGLDRKGDHVKYVDNIGNENIVGNIEQSGEKSCLPKEILEIMNVPGLTRIQVASYLQRCRINKRRPSKEKEYIRHRSSSDPEFLPVNTNNIYASSTEQQLYDPQLQVQQHYLSSFLSGQNNDGGRLQQQHGPLFGSQGPIIGSSNSNFYMPFNNGDHHDFNLNRQSQNDYNLDLNQPYVTTNSTSAIMTDMNGGNAIINGSGEANTNFQQYIGEENIFVPSNFIATSNTSANEGSDLNEWKNCDAYLNFHNMDDLYHNIGVSSSILPNENGNQYDQVYSIDQGSGYLQSYKIDVLKTNETIFD
ncbi:hypothetical protein H5410_022512 [Solanum commersonii]|uniref:Uncharacterized protein n=1 Tax=Solanum commersonii TaxID=4109 RepID=A0A9J5ZGZ4_SOLCO|nr:hypothetical protein H5410_022512 [Solanum commersonii]